jgi:glycosyltransferase involved in cell wall biosynthesis
MQSAPDVSVVIPTRGRPELLQRAIRSALRQSHRNIEVIVVLDGPDPGTVAAVAAIDDPRLSLVEMAAPVGGAEARNVGARAGKGKFIALLDDDDEWLPEKLARQLKLADATDAPAFVVVTRYVYRVEGQQDEVWPGHMPRENEPLSEFLFSSRGGFQTSTYLCPRDLFLAVPFTPGLKKHQDWDWFLRLAARPGFKLLIDPAPLSIYWVPLRSRNGVSGTIDWRFSAGWARSRLSLITPKAYASFLVKICLRGAMIQKENFKSIASLLREVLTVGRLTPMVLGDMVATVAIPETMRLRLRYGLLRLRRIG